MREINWKEDYPKMPEYMESQIESMVLRESGNGIHMKSKKKENNQFTAKKRQYRRIASFIICFVLVLSVTGVTLAERLDGYFLQLVGIYFAEGKEINKISEIGTEEAVAETNEGKIAVRTEESDGMEETDADEEMLEEDTMGVVAKTPEQFEFDIMKYGTVLNDSYQGDGYQINLKGLITDGYQGMIFYEIQMEDNVRADEFQWWGSERIYSEAGLQLSTGADTVLNQNGSSFNYVEFYTAESSLYGTTITLKNDLVIGMGMNPDARLSNPQYDCDLEIKIPIEEKAEMLRRTFEVQENADFGFYGEGVIENITITPLGIYLDCSTYKEKAEKGEYSDESIVSCKDGSQIELLASIGFSDETNKGHLSFGYPINPEEIVSFQLGDYIYTFEE